jgi:hypothetical protein
MGQGESGGGTVNNGLVNARRRREFTLLSIRVLRGLEVAEFPEPPIELFLCKIRQTLYVRPRSAMPPPSQTADA